MVSLGWPVGNEGFQPMVDETGRGQPLPGFIPLLAGRFQLLVQVTHLLKVFFHFRQAVFLLIFQLLDLVFQLGNIILLSFQFGPVGVVPELVLPLYLAYFAL